MQSQTLTRSPDDDVWGTQLHFFQRNAPPMCSTASTTIAERKRRWKRPTSDRKALPVKALARRSEAASATLRVGRRRRRRGGSPQEKRHVLRLSERRRSKCRSPVWHRTSAGWGRALRQRQCYCRNLPTRPSTQSASAASPEPPCARQGHPRAPSQIDRGLQTSSSAALRPLLPYQTTPMLALPPPRTR